MENTEHKLIHEMNREIGEVKGELIGINEKIDNSHDLQFEMHKENRADIKKILDQTTKTNGRVTRCEDFMTEQVKINSKLNGLFTQLFDEKLKEKQKKEEAQRTFWYKVFEKGIWILVGAIALLLGVNIKPFI